MKRRRITTWEDLEALPEGEWVEVEEGLDFKFVDESRTKSGATATFQLSRRLARSLKPKRGEVLKAVVKGNALFLEVQPAPVRRPGRPS